jgi:predicted permease
MAPQMRNPDYFTSKKSWVSLAIIGRLRADVPLAQAEAVADGVFQQYLDDPESRWVRQRSPEQFRAAQLMPAAKGLNDLRKKFSKPLWVLFGMVALVLAVACANTSSLLLARATARQREIAVRLSLGVSRARLVRQLLTESFVLALAGGAAGAVLAFWCTSLLLRFFATGEFPIEFQASPNLRVLGFTMAVAIASGIVFGLAPALRALKVDTNSALKSQSGATGRFAAGKAIVTAQVAICVVLLTAAGLLTQTLVKLKQVDTGFDRNHLLLATLDMRASSGESKRTTALLAELSSRLNATTGVRSVSFSDTTPVSASGSIRGIVVPGADSQPTGVWVTSVSPRYFETFGIRLLHGRTIADSDRPGRPLVAVISQSTARKFFAGANPVGRRFQFASARDKDVEIVGVVNDALQEDPRKPAAELIYTPLLQGRESDIVVLAVRTAGEPMAFAGVLRSQVREVSKNIAVSYIRTMPEQLSAMLLNENLLARLSSFFGVLAALLGCIGLYGVLSYIVTRRTREMGVRVALGAPPVSVRWLVIRQALTVAAAGLAIGIPAALFATRYIEGLLFKVPADDPVTYLGVAVLLGASAIVAAYWPARVASRVDPTTALRAE